MGLDLAEVVMLIEEELDLALPAEAPLRWNTATVADLVAYTLAEYRRQHPPTAPPTHTDRHVEACIIAILASVAARPSAEVRPDHRLLADLHLGD
jgi:hypothetical protein